MVDGLNLTFIKHHFQLYYQTSCPFEIIRYTGFSKRIEVGVSIYKVGGELSAGGMNRVPQSPRGGFSPSLVGGGYGGSPPENFEILDCRRCILSIFCPWILLKCLVLWKAFFFVKYTTMGSVAAGEKQGYTKQFSRQLSWQNEPQNISSARSIEKCCNI